MAELFGVDKSSISRHLKNIFETEELDEKVVVAKIETTTHHGAIEGKTRRRKRSKNMTCSTKIKSSFPILTRR